MATSLIVPIPGLTHGLGAAPDKDASVISLFLTLAVLAGFGAFGGFLFGYQQNGIVPPRRIETNQSFQLGWIGDCLIGIAGALAIFLLIPTPALIEGGEDVAQEIKIIALAIVGGFGGPAIIDMALSVTVKEIKDKLDRNDAIEAVDALTLRLVDKQLSDTSGPAPLDKLTDALRNASPRAQWTAFYMAKQARHFAWQDKKLGIVQRTIPIFRSLVESKLGANEHRYFAQLGYALKDQETPSVKDLEDAEDAMRKAIELRKEAGEPFSAMYEFNWAMCVIKKEEKVGEKGESKQRREVVAALRTIEELQSETLREKLKDYVLKECSDWLRRNGVMADIFSPGAGKIGSDKQATDDLS